LATSDSGGTYFPEPDPGIIFGDPEPIFGSDGGEILTVGGLIIGDPEPYNCPYGGEIITVGSDGGEMQQGLTYTIQLHDFDMDGVIDDGSITMVGPEDEFVIEHIFEDDKNNKRSGKHSSVNAD
jgi:hypothetical protein